MQQEKQDTTLAFYQVLLIEEEGFTPIGTFEKFSDALQARLDLGYYGTIQYWDGNKWHFNVTKEVE